MFFRKRILSTPLSHNYPIMSASSAESDEKAERFKSGDRVEVNIGTEDYYVGHVHRVNNDATLNIEHGPCFCNNEDTLNIEHGPCFCNNNAMVDHGPCFCNMDLNVPVESVRPCSTSDDETPRPIDFWEEEANKRADEAERFFSTLLAHERTSAEKRKAERRATKAEQRAAVAEHRRVEEDDCDVVCGDVFVRLVKFFKF